MAEEGEKEVKLRHTRHGMGRARPEAGKPIGRRKFIGRALAAAAVAVGLGVIAIKEGPKARDWAEENVFNPETDEQEKAIALLRTATEHDLVKNVVAVGEDVGGRKIANFRDRPRTPAFEHDIKAGAKEGELEEGDMIEEAVPVWGNDPEAPIDREREEVWIAFRHPNNPERAVFALLKLFEENSRTRSVKPYDLETENRREKRKVSPTR